MILSYLASSLFGPAPRSAKAHLPGPLPWPRLRALLEERLQGVLRPVEAAYAIGEGLREGVARLLARSPLLGVDHRVQGHGPDLAREQVSVGRPEEGPVGEAQVGQLLVARRSTEEVQVAGDVRRGHVRDDRTGVSIAQTRAALVGREERRCLLQGRRERTAERLDGLTVGGEALERGAGVRAPRIEADDVEALRAASWRRPAGCARSHRDRRCSRRACRSCAFDRWPATCQGRGLSSCRQGSGRRAAPWPWRTRTVPGPRPSDTTSTRSSAQRHRWCQGRPTVPASGPGPRRQDCRARAPERPPPRRLPRLRRCLPAQYCGYPASLVSPTLTPCHRR